jgi:hypothetical protein
MPDFILNPHATRAILSLIIAHQGTLPHRIIQLPLFPLLLYPALSKIVIIGTLNVLGPVHVFCTARLHVGT